MKELAQLAFLPLLFACKQVQQGAAAVEEAVGTAGALLTTAPMKKSPPPGVEDRRFEGLVDLYFDIRFGLNPAEATQAGLHEWDERFGHTARKQLEEAIGRLRQIDRDLAAIDVHALAPSRTIDWEILTSRVKADLLELERIRPYEKNPNYYLQLASEAAFSLAARDFAPAEKRLRALVARLRQIPGALDVARENLRNPPRVYTEIAIDQTDGAIQFFREEVPRAFPGKIPEDLRTAFEAANLRTIEALRGYRDWLERDLLPNSRGDFAIGKEPFLKKLLYEEMVDLPLETLIVKGEEELARLEERAKEVASQIHPGGSVAAVLREMKKDHPAAGEIVGSTAAGLEEIRRFCAEQGIVLFPGEEKPIVRETPPFRRSLSFASMDSPGPYEAKATEAFYSVTLPQPDWPKEKQEELLRFFNRYSAPVVSIHEAYPGHYTQFLWVKQAPSKVRKLLGCSSNAEGWAHYAEEMLLDEGFGNGDPRLRLAQIQLALVRACRYLVGIRLHTRGMTLSDATNFFIEHAELDRANAEREARRGTADPTYLVYTLGKKVILKLREDYKAAQGEGFQLGHFHNAFLSCGYPPLPIVRRLLLPGEKGSIL